MTISVLPANGDWVLLGAGPLTIQIQGNSRAAIACESSLPSSGSTDYETVGDTANHDIKTSLNVYGCSLSGNSIAVWSTPLDMGGGGAVVTAASGAFVDGSIVTIGTEADAPYGGSGNTTVIGALKGIFATPLPLPTGAAQEAGGNLAAVATVAGTPADTAWAGSGNSSIIAALKAIYAKVAGTLTATISGSVAVTGTFWQTTQPVSAANLPLPTGAATAANQANVQSAPGSLASAAITIQGNASGTPVPVSAASLPLPAGAATATNQPSAAAQGSTTAGQTGPLVQGAVTASGPSYTSGQTSPLSLTAVGALRVDGSAVTQPVSGTVTANAGTGTFAVSATSLPLPAGAAQEGGGNLAAVATAAGTPADAAWAGSGNSSIIAALKALYAKVAGTLTTTVSGSVAVTGTFWQATQPVSAATLPLPAGAATSANQVTAAAQGSTTSGQTGPLVQGAVTTSAPTYAAAETNPLSLDMSGNLRVGQPDVTATGQSLASGTTNAAISLALANAESIIGWVVSGLTASGAILTSELSKDGGTTWVAANNTSPGSGNFSTTLTADGSFRMHCAGSTNARLRVSTTGTGTITVSYIASAAHGIISLGDPLPTGSNVIGTANRGYTIDMDASTGSITAQDTTSTSATGNNGQSIVTGTPTTGSAVVFSLPGGFASATIQALGTWTGTLITEQTIDGSTWVPFYGFQEGTSHNNINYTANFVTTGNLGGSVAVRVRATATWTGTANIKMVASPNVTTVGMTNAQQFGVGLTNSSNPGSAMQVGMVIGSDLQPVAGATPYFNGSLSSTCATIKGSNGSLFGLDVYNSNSSTCYLQIFDSTAPTVGTTTPKFSFPVPATGSFSPNSISEFCGAAFATGIAIAFTTTATGNTAPSTAAVVNASYR
ncbi:MAG TPA: hypothetical protein VME69_06605 [Methylocella sp.]|nr:hypothetical protein [Methylocella sp.]